MKTMTSSEFRRREFFRQAEIDNAPRGRFARWLYFKRRLIAWAILWSVLGVIGIWMPSIPFTFLLLATLTALSGHGQLAGSRWGA